MYGLTIVKKVDFLFYQIKGTNESNQDELNTCECLTFSFVRTIVQLDLYLRPKLFKFKSVRDVHSNK